jgi:hypothetical protein
MANVFSMLRHRGNLFVLFVSVLLASCAKQADLPAEQQQPSKPKADKEFKKCAITKIIANNFVFPGRVYLFEYNDKGDPVKVTPSAVGTGSPVLHFVYDKKGRLLEFYGLYSNGHFEFWNIYQYDKKDVVVSDTSYGFGTYESTPTGDHVTSIPDPHFLSLTSYEYDAQGRVSRTTGVLPVDLSLGPFVREFHYDAAGNLQSFGALYDNRMNLRRTNAVWMFVDRNYSINNERPADNYNGAGLPTFFLSDEAWLMFLHGIFPRSIEYDCKGNLEN